MEGKAAADQLTEREKEILERLSNGLPDQRIADELFLSLNTVKWYNRQIYSKLGVSSRTQAIVRAKTLRLLDQDVSKSRLPAPKGNLPAQTTSFIGRRHEIDELKHLLLVNRLVTLTGTGGTGKTRLAVRLAAEIADTFADGVYFVDLAPISNPVLVASAIAQVLGVVENSRESLLETLKRVLAQRETLLLMDNFEQVVDASGLISELLAACSQLKVLVTSREPLHLSGEQEYPVPPLSLPQTDLVSAHTLDQSEAATLFIQRVQMIRPHFEVNKENSLIIAQICSRLDGLPLAIELAAARSKLLTPHALLERLRGKSDDLPWHTLTGGSRDAPPRQRTLRDSIEWSYNLLDDDEKRLFARLAVFRGGCSLEAIKAVCEQNLTMNVFDALASLLDKSLIQQKEIPGGEPRFVLLEMIREYAREQLESSSDTEAMRKRHALYFVELAERAEPELRLAGFDYWGQRFKLEQDNIREALEWTLSDGDVTLGVRLAGAIGLLWYGKGSHVEGFGWTQQLLVRLNEVSVTHHPKFLISAGHMSMLRNIDDGNRLFTHALNAARDLGDQLQTAWALILVGYTMLREPEIALPIVEEGLALFRELNSQSGIAQAWNIIGEIARTNGDDAQALRAYEECLAMSQQTGEARRICYMYFGLSHIAQHSEDYERSLDFGRKGLRLARDRNDSNEMANGMAVLAGCFNLLRQPQRAARLLGASEALAERLGVFHHPSDRPEIDRIIAALRAQLDDIAFQRTWAEGREMTLEEAIEELLDE